MNIYVYSDESGVFDRIHNDYFIFGGVVFLDQNERDNRERMYLSAERTVRKIEGLSGNTEVKASRIKMHRRRSCTVRLTEFISLALL